MKEVFKGKFATVSYIPEKKMIRLVFDGYVNMEETKIMYSTILSFMKSNKTVAFLNDLRKLKGTFTGMNQWIVEQMRPALGMGLKYSAMIVNNDIFTSFAIDDFVKKVTVLEVQLFQDEKSALQWIDEKMAG